MPIVEFEIPPGRRLLINVRRESTLLMVDQALTLSYDREGRMTGAWIQGRNYRRSLDNRVIEKYEGAQPGLAHRVRREMVDAEAQVFFADALARVVAYRQALDDAATRLITNSPPDDCQCVRDALDRILEWDWERLQRDRETFHIIYKPVSILPPDQYLALVLQATEGCSYNQCAFCGFYRQRKFYIKRLDEFRNHIHDVRAFFGGAIGLRKTIFLADANALMMPQAQLLPLFDVIHSELAIHPRTLQDDALKVWEAQHPIHFEGIYSFIDAFTTRRKTAREFVELAARGLRRVYIGLESGDAELLRFMGKPNSPDDVVQLVDHVKAGGVAVGIIILAGAGGDQYADQHVRGTIEIVNRLPLDKNDLIYFSELVDFPGSDYSALARDAKIRPLTIAEIEHQMTQMRAGFDFHAADAPKASYYDIREFIY